MIAVFGIGLLVVLVGSRLAPPSKPPESDTATVTIPEVRPPSKLRGLQYLHPDSNVVVAIQPGAIWLNLTTPDGNTRATLQSLGVPANALEILDRAGVPLSSIDHVVLGAAVREDVAEIPSLRLVMILREPLRNEEQFLKALQARRTTVADRELHQVKWLGIPGLMAWKANPLTWIFTNREKDLPAPEGGSGPTSPTLRALYSMKLPQTAGLWMAADDGDWSRKPSIIALATIQQKQDWLHSLSKVRSLAVGLSFGIPYQQYVLIQAADDATAETLKDSLRDQDRAATRTGRDVIVEMEGNPAENLERVFEKAQSALKP